MCPPAQPPPPEEIGLYWSDEQIILLLDEYTPGSHLLNNVIADSSPYQYPPSNLPEGIWYLVHSNEKKESAFGFWKAKGEACKIYSNSVISGWRTTLEYFEGQAPHGQRTDWLMQEYWITQKEISDKDKPKESRSLCRVFLCSGHSSKSEIESKKIGAVASIIPNANITIGQDSRSESKVKTECEVGLLPVVSDKKPSSSPRAFSELECFSRGDFLELNDLEEDPESHSSSSQNSSCPSKLSDEYFDSLALLRDLEDEENKYMQGKQSSSSYSFTTSVRPNDIFLQPPSSGSLLSAAGNTNVVEGSGTSSTVQERFADKRVQEHTTKRHSPDSRIKGTSNIYGVETPSTSHKNATQGEEKKAGACRMKKLKTYFCFTSF